MNFQHKNFRYVKKQFGEFIREASNGSKQYLRSLAAEKPADQPACFYDDFPSLRDDFHLPEQLETVSRNHHGSPLRISGPVNMWLHYDVRSSVVSLRKVWLITIKGDGECALPNIRHQSCSFVPTKRCSPFSNTAWLVHLTYGRLGRRAEGPGYS